MSAKTDTPGRALVRAWRTGKRVTDDALGEIVDAALTASALEVERLRERVKGAKVLDAGGGWEVVLSTPIKGEDGPWAICDENERGQCIDGRWRWPTADAAFAALAATKGE